MAEDKKLSELPAASLPLDPTDKLYVVQAGVSKQTTVGDLPTAPGGSGDVVGPSSAVADHIAVFDFATGKLIKDGGKTVAGVLSDAATAAATADSAVAAAAASDATTKANAAQAAAVQRSNHTGTQSADTLTDGTNNKAYTATERTKLAGIAAGATANSADATLLARANHTGTQSADTLTDGTTNKAFTATERTKLAGIAAGATVNSSDATLLSRTNHTGTQTASTISDFATAALSATASSYATAAQGTKADNAQPAATSGALATSGTITLTFTDAEQVKTMAISGNVTFGSMSGFAAKRSIRILISPDTVDRSIGFTDTLNHLGGALAVIPANKAVELALDCYGSTAASCAVKYVVAS